MTKSIIEDFSDINAALAKMELDRRNEIFNAPLSETIIYESSLGYIAPEDDSA
jgi:hypothetical protein